MFHYFCCNISIVKILQKQIFILHKKLSEKKIPNSDIFANKYTQELKIVHILHSK